MYACMACMAKRMLTYWRLLWYVLRLMHRGASGSLGMADNYQDMEQLLQSISDLMQEEKKYEQHIKMVTQNIRQLYDEEAFDKGTFENLSYITHEDMRSLESFKNQSVMAIKAPPGTTLEVPDPDEGMQSGKRRFQIFLKSTGKNAPSRLAAFVDACGLTYLCDPHLSIRMQMVLWMSI